MAAPPLSILIVLHDFALGGTERVAIRLACAWADRDVPVTIFAGSDAGPLRSLIDPNVEIVIADPPISRKRGSRRRLAQAARAFVSNRRFRHVFVPGNFHWPVAAALTGTGVAVIAQVSAALDKPQRSPIRQWAFGFRMRRLLRSVDAVVTLSDSARDQADRILRRRVSTTIALPALADDTPPPLPIPDARPAIIMAAGRLVPEKGFARVIDAVAALPDTMVRLVIVGDGPDMSALRRQSVALGVAHRVELVGYVTDIRPWLDAARLFILSSDFEGYPAVLVEALAAGRPVIATDCTPATRLLEAPGAGMVVPLNDSAALSRSIAAMLAQAPPDPAHLSALVEHHRIGAVAAAYLDLFAAIRP